MPKDSDIVQTFVDGRWGIYEYSRHPQWYISEDMAHIACIPRSPSPPETPDILFARLDAKDHWKEDPTVVVHGLGMIQDTVRKDLGDAAATVIKRTESLLDMPASK